MEQLRNYGGSLDETTSRRLETVSNKLKQQQGYPKSSVNVSGGEGNINGQGPSGAPSFTITDFSGVARNRLTVVGSGKLHCDPPPGWKHPSLDETEINVQNSNGKRSIIFSSQHYLPLLKASFVSEFREYLRPRVVPQVTYIF
jgi:hypothetical protein